MKRYRNRVVVEAVNASLVYVIAFFLFGGFCLMMWCGVSKRHNSLCNCTLKFTVAFLMLVYITVDEIYHGMLSAGSVI